jgi:hypothetical protein
MDDPKPAENLDQLLATRKTGAEAFCIQGQDYSGMALLQFWQWSVSDLVSNATRGRLAEFIIASALGIASDVRDEWDAFDLLTARRLRIEVKSCAYLQCWKQTRPSIITFSIRKTRAWDAATGIMQEQSSRQSDLYIFALLAHQESKKTLNPLDLDQWQFFPVPTPVLDGRTRSQHSITLKSLLTLCPIPLRFGDLAVAVEKYEAELLPDRANPAYQSEGAVASKEFMEGVEALPVQERECLGGK